MIDGIEYSQLARADYTAMVPFRGCVGRGPLGVEISENKRTPCDDGREGSISNDD